jgi:hypothetical protein
MTYAEHVQQVRAAVEGDPYFQLLVSKLASGHVIKSVSVLPPAPGDLLRWYRFVLIRLGALTQLDVPAGQEAVEHLLSQMGIRMASPPDEMHRCQVRLRRALAPLLQVAGPDLVRAALRGFVERAQPPVALALARKVWPVVSVTGPQVEVLVRALAWAFNGELARLNTEASYPWEEAALFADAGLAGLIASS